MTLLDRRLAAAALFVGLSAPLAAAQTDTPPAPPAAQAPAASPAPAAPADAAPVESATGAAAWERLKGNTITGKADGETFVEFFDPSGAVRYVDKDGLSTGTWTAKDNKICFDFPDDDDRSCAVFTVKGTKGSSLEDDGGTERFEILPGNPKGL